MTVGLALQRVRVNIVAFEQFAFFSRGALSSELPSADGDHLIFTIAFINAHQHWHAEYAIRTSKLGSTFSFELHLIDSEHVHLFVFLVETALLEFVEWVNVELVFLFDVLDVLLDFEEVWCQSRPALWRMNRPDVYAPTLNTGCCDERTCRVPLR